MQRTETSAATPDLRIDDNYPMDQSVEHLSGRFTVAIFREFQRVLKRLRGGFLEMMTEEASPVIPTVKWAQGE
jgi:hypothetical protein